MRKLSLFFLLLGVVLLGALIYRSDPARLWQELVHIGPSFGLVVLVGLSSLYFLASERIPAKLSVAKF